MQQLSGKAIGYLDYVKNIEHYYIESKCIINREQTSGVLIPLLNFPLCRKIQQLSRLELSSVTVLSVRARIILSDSSQCESSNYPQWQFSVWDFRVESQFSDSLKKMIIMRIHENNAYLLTVMDQDADSVWVMTLNCLGHNNGYLQ